MKTLLFFFFMASTALLTNDKPAYRLFTQAGDPVNYETLIDSLHKADVVLFGEIHNDPINHWLQLQVTQSLFVRKQQNLVLAAEMFEADDQLTLDELIGGAILPKHFVSEAKVWPNYTTDYQPLVAFAQQQQLQFVASNIPRRYASLVSREGLEALEELSTEAQTYIADLPIEVDMELPGYKNMLKMMGHAGHSGSGMRAENFVYAQAIKDATMAARILKYWDTEKQVLHFNGTYHSNNFEGIAWYLKKYKPELRVMTIAAAVQPTIQDLSPENAGLGNFILLTPSDMTKTH